MMPRRPIGVLIAILVAGGVAGWRITQGVTAAHAADPAPEPPLVPVTTAAAQVGDVPVLLDGLGTVQAFNVVQIKAQVSGTLVALPAREGQEVHKGDIVAEIDPRPYQAALDQANAKQQEDAATLQSAQLDLRRYQSLARSSFAPIQQVDDQQATVSKTQAAIAADNAAIETAKINLGYCVIRAPFDGRVSLYQVDVGNLIEPGSQTGIISITQDKPIAVVFTLPEADLARIQDARQQGPVPVLVSDGSNTDTNESKPKATGTLLTPNNTIDTTTGTISLKAQFANDDDHLWPGEFVNARVQVTVLHHAVTIPLPAVEHGPNGLFVYMVKPDQTIAQAMIQVGYEDNGRAVVTKGLSGNETVVVTGQSRLAPGTKVKATAVANAPSTQADSNAPG
jgi:multidrug efflux system membrane fusion protein